jgi:anti-sigma-K factor RskA
VSVGPAHERWEDAAGAYVLGALPDDERAGYEAHLATCASCRAEVDELRIAAEALPASAPAMRPPAALKARIMAEVEREAALLAAAGPQADRGGERAGGDARRRLFAPRRDAARRRRDAAAPSRPRWLGAPLGAAAALACVALLAGLGIGAIVFKRGGGQTIQFQRSGLPSTAVAELDVSGDQAVLVARGLPSPGSGRTYQVWLKHPGQPPQPTAALFTPRRDGSATATVTGKLHAGDQVMVTAEPDGGSPTPTSNPILAAKLT